MRIPLRVIIEPGDELRCDEERRACGHVSPEVWRWRCSLFKADLSMGEDRRLQRLPACIQAQNELEQHAFAGEPELREATVELARWASARRTQTRERLGPSPQLQAAAAALREKREELGLTREDLARAAGVADSTIRNIETLRHRPNRSTLMRLSAALMQQSGIRMKPGEICNGTQGSVEIEKSIL